MTNRKLSASLLTLMLSALTQIVIAQGVEPLFLVSQVEDNHLQTEVSCQEDPYCLNRYGYDLYSQHKLEEAIQIYLKAIELQQNSIDLHRESIAITYDNLGNAYRKQDKLTQAIQAYNEAIKYNFKYASAYNNLGYTLYLQNKSNPAAITNLRKAIKLEPNNSTYRTNLAKALRAQGKPQEANKVLSNVNPSDNPDFYNDRGYQRYRENKLDDAIADFKKAISLSPKSTFYNNLGNAYSAKGNFDLAIEEYRKAIKRDSDNASAYNGLGYALSINFGEEALKIQLINYNLPQLQNQGKIDDSSSIEFDFQPDNGQIEIEMNNASRLLIELQSSVATDNEGWFRGDLEVKDVSFNEIDTTGVNFNNDIEKSTIIKGEVRMGEKALKIEPYQFLLPEKPGIQRLSNIEVVHPKKITEIELRIAGERLEVAEAMEGLEVRLAGKTDRIQAGLDKHFPVAKIQSNLLSNLGFSNELIIVIISSASAIVVSLLTWLVNDFLTWLASAPKSTQNP